MTMHHDEADHSMPGHNNSHQGMGHGGHSWMMIACCIPMLVIAIVLVATGVVGVGFIFIAVICTFMMAMMMGAMDHGGDKA